MGFGAESLRLNGAWEPPWHFHRHALTEHKTKPTHMKGGQLVMEQRAKSNPLQRKITEQSLYNIVFTMFGKQSNVCRLAKVFFFN